MIVKNSSQLISLRSFVLVIGLTLLLAGCAHSSLDLKRTAVSFNSDRGRADQLPLLQASPSITPATATPTLIGLPEAGRPQPTRSAPSPTSVPTEPTVIPTQVSTTPPRQIPTATVPAPTQHYAPTRILIPAINLDASVIAVGWTVTEQNGEKVSEWNVPAERRAGWLNTSALVGVPGNTVLVGHQNVDGRVFENLEYLQLGDEIQLQAGNELHKYIIALKTIVPEKDQPLEVRLENARWIGRSNDERLTLITCWPRNDNTHRLIIVALPAT